MVQEKEEGEVMMRIFKYPLINIESQEVKHPANWRPLHVGMQSGRITIWAEVDPDENEEEEEKSVILIIPTGGTVPPDIRYLGTALDGPYVWHVYED